jgi:predicted small secreted protein
MMRRLPLLFAALLTGSLLLSACDSTGVNEGEDGEAPTLVTVENLPADPDTTTGGGRPQGYNQFAFFDLRDSTVVLHSDAENRADSASTEWDVAFRSTDVIVNGGDNGPGQGAAYVAEEAFQNVTEVNPDSLTEHTIENWYTYNANGNHVVRPTPGRTIVVRTADGEAYAKIRILSYYEGAPDNPAESDAESRYYTFEYVLQTDGTSFE